MKKLKLLIAEDDNTQRLLYEEGFNGKDFDFRFAVDGEEALKEYRAWKPDAILLDIMMPVKSGYVVLKEIRDEEKKSEVNTVIIMATGMADKNDIMDCLKLGIQGYIVKPFKRAEIADRVMELYRKARPE